MFTRLTYILFPLHFLSSSLCFPFILKYFVRPGNCKNVGSMWIHKPNFCNFLGKEWMYKWVFWELLENEYHYGVLRSEITIISKHCLFLFSLPVFAGVHPLFPLWVRRYEHVHVSCTDCAPNHLMWNNNQKSQSFLELTFLFSVKYTKYIHHFHWFLMKENY